MIPLSIQKFDLEDTGKIGCHRSCIIDDQRVSHQTEDLTRSHKCISVAMSIGGALTNALAFTGSSYLLHRPSADSIDKERVRHDAAIEQL